jgi:hypothetical protein
VFLQIPWSQMMNSGGNKMLYWTNLTNLSWSPFMGM